MFKTNRLICPLCKTRLHRENNSLFCERERPHCFDIAKSGYVTLTKASGSAGDDREMVRARSAFLDTDAYLPFAKAIISALHGHSDVIIDAGCGEGYYTNLIADNFPGSELYGFDLSKSACDRAAKRAKLSNNQPFFGVSSIYELPMADKSAAAVISIFAPIAEAEFRRVLSDDGILIIGAAGKRHLYELKAAVYDEVYENEGRRDLPSGFSLIDSQNLSYKFTVYGENIKNLFMMTPYAFKTSVSDSSKLDSIDELQITADFDIFVYKKTN